MADYNDFIGAPSDRQLKWMGILAIIVATYAYRLEHPGLEEVSELAKDYFSSLYPDGQVEGIACGRAGYPYACTLRGTSARGDEVTLSLNCGDGSCWEK